MTPEELYEKLCEMGADFEIVEIFEGARIYRFHVDEGTTVWVPAKISSRYWGIMSHDLAFEYKDKQGDWFCFDTEEEAQAYIDKEKLNEDCSTPEKA